MATDGRPSAAGGVSERREREKGVEIGGVHGWVRQRGRGKGLIFFSFILLLHLLFGKFT